MRVHTGTVKRRHLKMAAIGNVSNEGVSGLTQAKYKATVTPRRGDLKFQELHSG